MDVTEIKKVEGTGMNEYIEREAVLNLLEKINPVDFGSVFDYSLHGAVFECLREARYGVEDIPAADVAEVRHARWIKHEGYDECEACHAKAIYGSNYCPSCGALMDKEDGHETS